VPKIVDHDQYRKELLRQCFDLFAVRGYAALTMRQLAQGLGVSTGTLYHYFPSKEALFEQLIQELTVQDLQAFVDEMAKYPTPLARTEAVFEFIAEREEYFINQNLLWVEFYQHQNRTTRQRPQVFQQVWKQNEQWVMDAVGIQDKVLLNLIGCFIDGMLLHRMFEGEEFEFEHHKELLLDMLRPYLEVPVDVPVEVPVLSKTKLTKSKTPPIASPTC
jgi:AcrR family transcriptional regulator